MRTTFSRSTSCLITLLAAVALSTSMALAQGNSPNSPAPAAPAKPAIKPSTPANEQPSAPGNATPAPTTKPASPAEGAKEPASEAQLVYVQMKTSKGDIVLELNRAKAPVSVDNFLRYVDRKYYDGLIFHRVISTFMIQGGGFSKDMVQKATDEPIKNEWRNGLKNRRGAIAMARLNQPDTATSQFFINVVDNDGLDQPQRDGAAYAVFGKVISGMNVVDAIKAVPTQPVKVGRATHEGVPIEPVTIESVTRITIEEAQAALKRDKAASQKPEQPAEKKPASPG